MNTPNDVWVVRMQRGVAAEVNSAALATLNILGPNGIIREQPRVHLNFIRALDQFVG